MPTVLTTPRERARSMLAAAVVQGVIGYLLLSGLIVDLPGIADEQLKTFEIASEPPADKPDEPPPPPRQDDRREGAASPPNLRARATPIVAPPPVIPPPVPPPLIAAETPGTGSAPFAGNADIRGPGTGSGGIGNGSGSGGRGDGDGGGGGGRGDTPPRHIGGRIRHGDFPRAFDEAGIGGTVGVRFLIEIDGRVPECEITRSSGTRELDALTCRLIRERFRFRPALDERGRPFPSMMTQNHEWVVEEEPPEERPQRRERRLRFP